MNKKIKGAFGEDLATNYLIKNKYKIIARNYSCALGEIDIVALDKNILVFIDIQKCGLRSYVLNLQHNEY